MICYDMIFGLVWLIWCAVIRCDVVGLDVRCDVVWYDLIDVMGCDMMWLKWRDLFWFGIVSLVVYNLVNLQLLINSRKSIRSSTTISGNPIYHFPFSGGICFDNINLIVV